MSSNNNNNSILNLLGFNRPLVLITVLSASALTLSLITAAIQRYRYRYSTVAKQSPPQNSINSNTIINSNSTIIIDNPTHLTPVPLHSIGLNLIINEDHSGSYLGSIIWEGGYALSLYLQTLTDRCNDSFYIEYIRAQLSGTIGDLQLPRNFLHNKRIVELGSGTGITGITAAKCGAREVILTDIKQVLPILQSNIRSNFPQSDWNTDSESLVYIPDNTNRTLYNNNNHSRLTLDSHIDFDSISIHNNNNNNSTTTTLSELSESALINQSKFQSTAAAANIDTVDIKSNNQSNYQNTINSNNPPLIYPNCKISTCELLWGLHQSINELPVILQSEPIDILLLADVVYDAYSTEFENIDNFRSLFNTIELLTSNPNTIILLTYTFRREKEKLFFDLIAKEYQFNKCLATDLLPEHSIDSRIEIYKLTKTKWAKINSLRPHLTSSAVCNHLDKESIQQEEILQQKLKERSRLKKKKNSTS